MTDRAARQVRGLEERLDAGCRRAWPACSTRTSGLSSTLKEARDQIVALKEEVDRLAQPPSGYGYFLGRHDDGTVDVFTGGRKLRVVGVARARDRGAAARPGGHAQRGDERRRGAVVRAAGRHRDAQGGARGRRPRAGHRAHRRRARRDARRLAARHAAASGRLAAARVAVRLRLRADPEVRGRGARPRGGPGHRLRGHRWAARPDRDDPRRRRAAVPAQGAVHRAPAAAAEGHPALRPARLRQDADREGRRELAGQEGRRGRQGRGAVVLPQHQGPRAAQQVRRGDRAAHPAGVPAGPREGQRRHAGHRLLRRDGLDLPYPWVRCVLRRREHDRAAAAAARSTASRGSRTSS